MPSILGIFYIFFCKPSSYDLTFSANLEVVTIITISLVMVIVIIATQWIASTITIVMLMTCSTISANIVVFFHHPHHNYHAHHLYHHHHLVCSTFSANLVVVVPSRLSSQLPPPPFPFWLLRSQHLREVKTLFLAFNSTFYSISNISGVFDFSWIFLEFVFVWFSHGPA